MRKLLVPRVLTAIFVSAWLTAVPPSAQAQYHGHGPYGPPGHVHVGIGVGFGYGYPYYGFGFGFGFGWYPFYNPWYPGWYPYAGWYPPYYPYYPYYPYGYGGSPDYLTASLRLEVKPRDAEVYVDGYLAGKVDDFDGMFQRLRVRPGEHDLVLYRDGLRTVKQHLYLAPNSDQRVQFVMEALAPGETADPRPQPPAASDQPSPMSQEPPQPPPGYGNRPNQPPPQNQPPPGQQSPPNRGGPPPPEIQVQPEAPPSTRSFGALALNVQPGDAEILVDGHPWTMAPGESRLVIQLPDGRHHVEIRKSGFESYTEDVGIQRGRTLSLNVSLIRSTGSGR